MGVVCPGRSKSTIHSLRECMESHWNGDHFMTLKIVFQNAFNVVSRQALLDECHSHFPELMPWASWCYGQHLRLFYSMGTISFETGQQRDPWGQKLVASDEELSQLLYHKLYMDDVIVAGSEKAVARVIAILKEAFRSFPEWFEMRRFLQGKFEFLSTPNLEVLRSPIGVMIFCAKSACQGLCLAFKAAASWFQNPQVAYLLLHFCGSFCKMVHLARSKTPSLVAEALGIFRGLALSLLFSHSGIALGENHHLEQSYIAETEAICLQDILDAPLCQRYLSSKIEGHQLKVLFDHSSSPATRARLLSVSSHASSIMPTPQQNLHLESQISGGAKMMAWNGHFQKLQLFILPFARPRAPGLPRALLLVKVEATQSSGTIICRTPSGNRVSWPILQVKSRQAVA